MMTKESYVKKRLKRVIVTAMTFCLTITSPVFTKTQAQAETQMRDAWTITKDMKAGWNLGNSLESENDETGWGNPRITKCMIDAVHDMGFSTLRVPVRWDDHYIDSNYTIDTNYLERVKEVVNYGINNDMYVILNVHHNDLQTKTSTEYWQQEQVKNELRTIWTQIANYFKDYGDKLVFEVNNEPRAGEDWGGNSGLYDCVNQYNEAARAAIRATGGNNSLRLVMLPTYCASSDEPKLAGWKNLSSDDRIAVSIHAYVPFGFAYEGNTTQWNNNLHEELKFIFGRYYTYFHSKGIPVVIGEFGATNMNNTYDRVQYTSAYGTLASNSGIPSILWDNHKFDYGQENYGLLDRYTCTFRFPEIAKALVDAYGGNGGETGDPYKSLYWSETGSSASGWDQAVSVMTEKNGGTFKGSDITRGGYFYVEYDGTQGGVEFILQNFDSKKWAKVTSSESGSANGHYYAKFSYDNCVSAFGTDNFNDMLDQIHVGATDNWINVYSVCYCYPN